MGKQTRDFVYVGDVARAVSLACEKRISGSYNIGTGVETDVNKLYEVVVKHLGKDIQPNYEELRKGEQLRSCIDPALAKADLGWEAKQDIESGLGLTCDWFHPTPSSVAVVVRGITTETQRHKDFFLWVSVPLWLIPEMPSDSLIETDGLLGFVSKRL